MRAYFTLVTFLALAAPAVSNGSTPPPATEEPEETEEALKARLITQLDTLDAMEVRVRAIRDQVRSLPSASDLELDAVGKVQDAAWEARALVPSALATAKGFRDTWPTLETTLTLFLSKNDAYRKNGEVETSLRYIENSVETIEADLSARVDDYADSMSGSRRNLDSALELMSSARATALATHARNASGQADHIEACALSIQAIYPWEPQPGTAPPRAMDERQRGWSQAAREALPHAEDGRAQAGKKLEALAAEARERIAGARFPAPKLSGGEWKARTDEATALITKSWRTPPERVRRVGIDGGWEERQEWVRRNSAWRWQQYRFFSVRAALELDGERCMVYSLTFRQDKTSSGWSPLELWGVANSYEMLLDNVAL